MNKQEFLNYIKEVEQLYRYFQKNFMNKDYVIEFSSGESINFSFYEQQFAHLVGIQIGILKKAV